MGTTTIEELETKVLELSRDLAQHRLDFQKHINTGRITGRIPDAPHTNAPAHETLPSPRPVSPADPQPVRANSPHDSLADVLGYPKEGR